MHIITILEARPALIRMQKASADTFWASTEAEVNRSVVGCWTHRARVINTQVENVTWLRQREMNTIPCTVERGHLKAPWKTRSANKATKARKTLYQSPGGRIHLLHRTRPLYAEFLWYLLETDPQKSWLMIMNSEPFDASADIHQPEFIVLYYRHGHSTLL